MEQKMEKNLTRRILDMVMEAGKILLANGAEIARVEETMVRMAKAFGVDSARFAVMGKAIFVTGEGDDGREQYAKIEHIPVSSVNFEKIVAVNQLSRDIEQGKYTLDQTEAELARIRALKGRPLWLRTIVCGIGSACFCGVLGGGWLESAVVLIISALIYLCMEKLVMLRVSKAISNLLASALATLLCLLCYRIGFGQQLSYMVVGSIIPLVPGIAMTNGIRDMTGEDYISGTVRMLDAVLVFMCIAIGVGVTLMLSHSILGGALL